MGKGQSQATARLGGQFFDGFNPPRQKASECNCIL